MKDLLLDQDIDIKDLGLREKENSPYLDPREFLTEQIYQVVLKELQKFRRSSFWDKNHPEYSIQGLYDHYISLLALRHFYSNRETAYNFTEGKWEAIKSYMKVEGQGHGLGSTYLRGLACARYMDRDWSKFIEASPIIFDSATNYWLATTHEMKDWKYFLSQAARIRLAFPDRFGEIKDRFLDYEAWQGTVESLNETLKNLNANPTDIKKNVTHDDVADSVFCMKAIWDGKTDEINKLIIKENMPVTAYEWLMLRASVGSGEEKYILRAAWNLEIVQAEEVKVTESGLIIVPPNNLGNLQPSLPQGRSY